MIHKTESMFHLLKSCTSFIDGCQKKKKKMHIKMIKYMRIADVMAATNQTVWRSGRPGYLGHCLYCSVWWSGWFPRTCWPVQWSVSASLPKI